MASRVNGDCPAANLRDKPLLAILAQSRYVRHTSCGTSLLHAVMPTLKWFYGAIHFRPKRTFSKNPWFPCSGVILFSTCKRSGLTFYSTN